MRIQEAVGLLHAAKERLDAMEAEALQAQKLKEAAIARTWAPVAEFWDAVKELPLRDELASQGWAVANLRQHSSPANITELRLRTAAGRQFRIRLWDAGHGHILLLRNQDPPDTKEITVKDWTALKEDSTAENAVKYLAEFLVPFVDLSKV